MSSCESQVAVLYKILQNLYTNNLWPLCFGVTIQLTVSRSVGWSVGRRGGKAAATSRLDHRILKRTRKRASHGSRRTNRQTSSRSNSNTTIYYFAKVLTKSQIRHSSLLLLLLLLLPRRGCREPGRHDVSSGRRGALFILTSSFSA